jgi:oligoendopeptidase F
MKMTTVRLRQQIEEKDRWNLEATYSDKDLWEKDILAVQTQLPKLQSFQGRLSESAKVCAEFFQLYFQSSLLIEKIHSYAHLNNDEDTTDSSALELYQRARALASTFYAATSFLTPEIIAFNAEKIKEYLESKELSDYKFYLESMIRYQAHTLSPEEEKILAESGEVLGSLRSLYSQLVDADFEPKTMIIDGVQTTVTLGKYIDLMKNPSEEIRKEAYQCHYSLYEGHKNSLTALLSTSTKVDALQARLRKYPSSIEMALFHENVQRSLVDTLLASVEDGIALLHRYMNIRAKCLKKSKLNPWDLAAPLAEIPERVTPYEKAVEWITQSVKPMGESYAKDVHHGLLEGRWVDRYETKGKRSGAYSGGSYRTLPYILMNYTENSLNHVFTLAHEAGHSMHTKLIWENQPFHYSEYSIFIAEVASTFHENLLFDYLCKEFAHDTQLTLGLVAEEIDKYIGTFFRQALYSYFELEIHDLADKRQALTPDTVTELWKKLTQKFYGPLYEADSLNPYGGLRVPHFYSQFYVYKYATGLAASVALATKVLRKEDQSVENYLNFLKVGASVYPLEALKIAGVDMTQKAPYQEILGSFEGLINRLEELLATK